MPPPTAPPARPHSAHPHMALPAALFRTQSASRLGRGSSSASLSLLSTPPTHNDWEDAWDSSSDHGDDDDGQDGLDSLRSLRIRPHAVASPVAPVIATSPPPRAATAPIPIRPAPSQVRQTSPPASDSISTSWVSASFHPTPQRNTPPSAPAHRAMASASPRPSTSSLSQSQSVAAPTGTSARLPGGAWELVDRADAELTPAPAVAGSEALRPDAEDILRDPFQLLAGLAPPTPASAPASPAHVGPGSGRASPAVGAASGAGVSRQRSVRTARRRERFARALRAEAIDIGELKGLAWSGVPEEVRPIVWQLLLNYLPLPCQPRLTTLQRKRKEYAQLVEQYFGRGPAALDQTIWHQIEIDVPRTRPGVYLWSCEETQRALERILYVWAIRHPASGYVQGINDLATPFFEVFLSAYLSVDPEIFDITHLPAPVLAAVEADAFWCLTKLLDGIQDHYISHQPGIQRLVKRMGDLVKRIDAPLAAHFDDQGVEYMQFAFRWMNCLLMREISVKCTIRMWDTYLSEGADAFSQFHLYVCVSLLRSFSDRLMEMDFQEIIMFLQRIPTQSWTDHEIEFLLADAYVLKATWQGAENHLANLPNGHSYGMLGK